MGNVHNYPVEHWLSSMREGFRVYTSLSLSFTLHGHLVKEVEEVRRVCIIDVCIERCLTAP